MKQYTKIYASKLKIKFDMLLKITYRNKINIEIKLYQFSINYPRVFAAKHLIKIIVP